jgi:hypothetical protein
VHVAWAWLVELELGGRTGASHHRLPREVTRETTEREPRARARRQRAHVHPRRGAGARQGTGATPCRTDAETAGVAERRCGAAWRGVEPAESAYARAEADAGSELTAEL